MSAEQRVEQVRYLLSQKRFLRREDGYEVSDPDNGLYSWIYDVKDGHYRFLAPQIAQFIFLLWFGSSTSPARRNTKAWLDGMTPTTIAFVCTALWFSLRLYERTGVIEKAANGRPLLQFRGNCIIG